MLAQKPCVRGKRVAEQASNRFAPARSARRDAGRRRGRATVSRALSSHSTKSPPANSVAARRPDRDARRRAAGDRHDLDVCSLEAGLILEDLPVVLALLALDRLHRAGRAARGAAVQEIFGGLTGDHPIRDCIGMALVGVTDGADPAFQLDAAALLNGMRGLVRDSVQIGTAAQDDVIVRRVRLGTHGLCGRSRFGAGVSPDRRDVVATERALERVRARQGRGGRRQPPGRRGMHDRLVARVVLVGCALLHDGRDDLLDQGLLARSWVVRVRLGS